MLQGNRKLQNSRVLISGASVAGPALAYWLNQYGFQVTVVEKASTIRPGGQAVDFKGAVHRTVLERMGILEAVRQARVPDAGDGVIVNADGRKIATVPAVFSAGEIEIMRGDLAQILHQRTIGSCEYLFGDSVVSLSQASDGVLVSFQRAAPRVFDLVVGADGIHSNIRRLAFGPESQFVHFLGYYYALAKLSGEAGGQELMYNEPGRMVMTGGSKAPAFFVFASSRLDYQRDDLAEQKDLLAKAYAGGAWKLPTVMAEMPHADEFYMDSISRVTMDRYAQGRVVLLGDAAYGCALGGFGTGLAIVGAYVLAGELMRADGDYKTAYARYEAKFRKYASVSQNVNAGKFLAPKSRFGIELRNRVFSAAALFGWLIKLIDHFASDIQLENYPADAG